MDEHDEVLIILQKKIEFHEAEIQKIKNAIAAYKGETTVDRSTYKTPKRKVKWTQEIKTALANDQEMTSEEIKQFLLNKGIDQLMDAGGRSSLTTTLSRMTAAGKLIKSEDQKFRLPPKIRRRVRRMSIDNTNEQSES